MSARSERRLARRYASWKSANRTTQAALPQAHGSGAVPCAVCGCGGDMDCGHAPLDAAEVCPCCRVNSKRPNAKAEPPPPDSDGGSRKEHHDPKTFKP